MVTCLCSSTGMSHAQDADSVHLLCAGIIRSSALIPPALSVNRESFVFVSLKPMGIQCWGWVARDACTQYGALACGARLVAKDSIVGALLVRSDARGSEL
jgi:hypothetical protein